MNALDLIVIGGGPGGYVAAIRAAQLGLNVLCVDQERLGGTCLNWGCIPTKALLRSAEVLELCRTADRFGINVSNVDFDFQAIIARSRKISENISKSLTQLVNKNKIHHVEGMATIIEPGTVEITHQDEKKQTLTATKILIATGATATQIPNISVDHKKIINYKQAMTLPVQPKSLAIIGGGAIGVEFASFYNSLGTEVTLIETAPRLLPNADKDISDELEKALTKRGVQLKLARTVKTAKTSDHVSITIVPQTDSVGQEMLSVDNLLVAVGITPNLSCLQNITLLKENGFVKVDDYYQTSVHNIYAIGDVIDKGPALAHVASAQGTFIAEHLAGQMPHPIDYDTIPACVYCHPEIAWVGMTEQEAKKQNIPTRIGRFSMATLGKTIASGEYPGLVKVIWHEKTGALLGAHLIGAAVTDMIAEPTLAKSTEVNAESLLNTVHAHPTFVEAIKEATDHAYGKAIHR